MQAARGASLSDHPAERAHDVTGGRPRTSGRHVGLVLGIAVVAFVVDQVTKYLAVEHLAGRPAKPLVGELLQLTYTRNPGAAFSTGTGLTPVITVVAIVAAVVVLWLTLRLRSTFWAVGFGFLLAGIVGNLADRLFREPGPFRGHVVDFLMLPHWPVFNVADVCINVAAVVIVVQALRGVRLDGRRSDAATESGERAREQ
ncbi:signal peptidase II [Nocardioides mangrovicus]|uniref:Lipoprotein signal peptidase n=1 Tax=Nocardioides mangrovicus TaxID=2478913 RepID=A0A3L8P201_9ACTN|nr:signal peptidase II [Nocardioides mangrovicus]RLV49416.1 signal peptidase II [Nocardioides mangrovicus]